MKETTEIEFNKFVENKGFYLKSNKISGCEYYNKDWVLVAKFTRTDVGNYFYVIENNSL